MKKELIKLVTTDCAEIRESLIDDLSDEFAEVFWYEGCVDKSNIILAEQLASLTSEELYIASLGNSNLPNLLTEIFKKAIDKIDKNSKNIHIS